MNGKEKKLLSKKAAPHPDNIIWENVSNGSLGKNLR